MDDNLTSCIGKVWFGLQSELKFGKLRVPQDMLRENPEEPKGIQRERKEEGMSQKQTETGPGEQHMTTLDVDCGHFMAFSQQMHHKSHETDS